VMTTRRMGKGPDIRSPEAEARLWYLAASRFRLVAPSFARITVSHLRRLA
jgi:hypothetical protein